jgi:hypothetical protein
MWPTDARVTAGYYALQWPGSGGSFVISSGICQAADGSAPNSNKVSVTATFSPIA